jgi:Domain of unknown function (DUF5667)
MPRPKPNKLHDELDALLDGRPVELTDELAPLAEAADALRAELAAHQLDPEVADRHLERVLHGSATVVPLPVRGQPSGWDLRRRVAAVVLAAALVLAPATMASAAALPGQPMYPFKRAIEELRIASVQWSPSREATERTRVADARLGELNRLFTLKIFAQVPTAITALSKAVQQAEDAVDDATREGEPVPTSVASKLSSVKAAGGQALVVAKAMASQSILPAGTRDAINAAVVETQTQGVLVPPNRDTGSGAPSGSTPTPTPPQAPADPASGPPTPGSQTQPSVTTPVDPTTTEPQVTTTTTPPTTTTEPEPSTTESTVTPGSAGGGDGTGGEQTGADGRTTGDAAPAEQAPADVPAP